MLDTLRVSIHVPARGTTRLEDEEFDRIMFQSTFPQGERPCWEYFCCTCLLFQSTFPQGERQESGIIFRSSRSFNPRSRKGNDPKNFHLRLAVCPFQSTFPQGERRESITASYTSVKVSIHVPARGTTVIQLPIISHLQVSIHVPARGTTRTISCAVWLSRVSIHVPARGTTQQKEDRQERSAVSIHVPARGTTAPVITAVVTIIGFNPRSRKGND